MVGLCTNRSEGFGPSSQISSPLPTQCFIDVILAPLPTWLFIILTLSLLVTTRFQYRDARPPRSTTASTRGCVRWLLAGTYYFLIFVIILMESVEIGRLAQAELGIGLLPFVYVGCLLAMLQQASYGACRGLRGWWVGNLVFWALGLVVTALKIAALVRFGFVGELGREEGIYPVVHQFTDLVILVIFYGLLVVAEVAMVVLRMKGKGKDEGALVDENFIQLRESTGN